MEYIIVSDTSVVVVEKQIAELTETLSALEFKEWYCTTAKKRHNSSAEKYDT